MIPINEILTLDTIKEWTLEGYKAGLLGAFDKGLHSCMYYQRGHYCAAGYLFHRLGIPDDVLMEINVDELDRPVGVDEALALLQELELIDDVSESLKEQLQKLQDIHDDWILYQGQYRQVDFVSSIRLYKKCVFTIE